MKNTKYDIIVYYKEDHTRVSISRDAEIEKLVKMIKLLFEPLDNINFELIYQGVNLLNNYTNHKLSQVFGEPKNLSQVKDEKSGNYKIIKKL